MKKNNHFTNKNNDIELLNIVDECGNVYSPSGDIIPAGTEAADKIKSELQAENAEKEQERLRTVADAEPPHMRKLSVRNYKNAFAPDYISPDPADINYISNVLTDVHAARVIAAELNGWLINDATPATKGAAETPQYWRYWNGCAYVPDAERMHRAIDNIHDMLLTGQLEYLRNKVEATGKDAEKTFTAYLKWVNGINGKQKRNDILSLLRNLPGMSRDFETEGNHDLLSVDNCIIDTAGGDIIPAGEDLTPEQRSKVYQTRQELPHHYLKGRIYKPHAETPKFDRFLIQMFTDNQDPDLSESEICLHAIESMEWMWRFFGYLLTAGNREQIITCLIGSAGTGKSELMKIIQGVLTPAEFACPNIRELQSGTDAGPKDSMSKAISKRVAYFDEGSGDNSTHTALSINTMKQISSGGTTSEFRSMYKGSRDSLILCKPVLSMNDPPVFDKPIDDGMNRRLIVIPCNHKVLQDERKLNYHAEIVREEGDAIFSRMVAECREYCTKGRLPPIPDYWRKYKSDVLSGSIYTEFMTTYYSPISIEDLKSMTQEERTKYRVYKHELHRDIIIYARNQNREDELGKLVYYDNSTIGNQNLSTKSAGRLRAALIEMGYGEYKNRGRAADGNGAKPYIYARRTSAPLPKENR